MGADGEPTQGRGFSDGTWYLLSRLLHVPESGAHELKTRCPHCVTWRMCGAVTFPPIYISAAMNTSANCPHAGREQWGLRSVDDNRWNWRPPSRAKLFFGARREVLVNLSKIREIKAPVPIMLPAKCLVRRSLPTRYGWRMEESLWVLGDARNEDGLPCQARRV